MRTAALLVGAFLAVAVPVFAAEDGRLRRLAEDSTVQNEREKAFAENRDAEIQALEAKVLKARENADQIADPKDRERMYRQIVEDLKSEKRQIGLSMFRHEVESAERQLEFAERRLAIVRERLAEYEASLPAPENPSK